MKRMSKRCRNRHQRRRLQVLRHWKKKGRATRSSISKARRREKRNSSKGYKPLVRYLAPKVISIDPPHYRSELLELLRKLRLHFRDDASRGVLIDFRQTSHLVADGTLLLYAELNRLMAYTNSAMKLRCTEPLNDRASQVLKQVGIYRLCSNRSPVRPSREDVVHWQVVQGMDWATLLKLLKMSRQVLLASSATGVDTTPTSPELRTTKTVFSEP